VVALLAGSTALDWGMLVLSLRMARPRTALVGGPAKG
jgi:hypothetical protein